MNGFFRYPGGKSKLQDKIISKFGDIKNFEYREPFFGGGSIGIKLLQNLEKIWINDFDIGISALWTSAIKYPEQLKNLINNFSPSVENFYIFKEELINKNDLEIVELGFKKLAIHQMSFSGLGTKAGGPIGGKEQRSKYLVNCRWSPNYICKKIDFINKEFNDVFIRQNCCTNLDFSEIINDTNCDAFLYLDPPYYEKGNELYQFGFSDKDHVRLADCLKNTSHKWVLSYDNHPRIHELYSWANIEKIFDIKYSIKKSRRKEELLITRK